MSKQLNKLQNKLKGIAAHDRMIPEKKEEKQDSVKSTNVVERKSEPVSSKEEKEVDVVSDVKLSNQQDSSFMFTKPSDKDSPEYDESTTQGNQKNASENASKNKVDINKDEQEANNMDIFKALANALQSNPEILSNLVNQSKNESGPEPKKTPVKKRRINKDVVIETVSETIKRDEKRKKKKHFYEKYKQKNIYIRNEILDVINQLSTRKGDIQNMVQDALLLYFKTVHGIDLYHILDEE
ncbi:hypothetical protein [Thermoflavimicrobium daqui]|uniref:Uncharacterized protein n=1 Tax=Thermoflavimicrobium daqui TaxID=2137476 RepID=A0A364K1M7_9BACL|nr:hypothetical protein [Thermoflavimicrobium daqui]RAL21938.1 hypothetical protein DL897_15215 [Thermoflavimicrobium daqui]